MVRRKEVKFMVEWVSPKRLYPTISLSSVNEEKIKLYMKCFSDDIATEQIRVFLLSGNLYILRGHHKMLAANRLGIPEIRVDVVNTLPEESSVKGEDIMESVRIIGLTALYDFEAVGGFQYDEYPEYYEQGKN